MERLSAPAPFNFDGKISEKWKSWKQDFEFYMCATESDQKSDKIKAPILLTCTGEQGREIYQTFELDTDTDKLKLQPVLAKVENYCNPRTNTTIIRHKFFTYKHL